MHWFEAWTIVGPDFIASSAENGARSAVTIDKAACAASMLGLGILVHGLSSAVYFIVSYVLVGWAVCRC